LRVGALLLAVSEARASPARGVGHFRKWRDPRLKPGHDVQARDRKPLVPVPRHVAVEHVLGHVDDPPAGGAGVVAQALEGLALVRRRGAP
jgi:hypothetical protein